MSQQDLKQLLKVIEQQLDWGSPASWQSKDFEILNELILEKTKVSLSASTLRRLWGRVEYNHMPSGTTLDTLAKFAGFENWRNFTKNRIPAGQNGNALTHAVPSPAKRKRGMWPVVTKAAITLAAIALAGMYVRKNNKVPAKGPYSFTSRPVTRSIPNSVIFDYRAITNPGDSLFIQQSWDPTTRSSIDKNKHQFTSIYYRPGFYHAKLLINNKIVKQHNLLIPTKGWLGLIANYPIPVYLDSTEFIRSDMMQVLPSTITKNNIQMEPNPPVTEFYNVGNFETAPLKNFSFISEVKNNFHDGAAACEYVDITLFTDDTPVIVQLCAKGCVSNLRLLNGGYFISGKDNDLSGFGTDLSQWTKLECKSDGKKIRYFLNGKQVYETQLPLYTENIVGIGYRFAGAGSVKNIQLKKGEKIVFSSY
ncbi:MAG: hypothetical protein JST19_04900 [Bacteroidetes bacterium]|nr:hypothetical protein [Bacteroidota bacterium]